MAESIAPKHIPTGTIHGYHLKQHVVSLEHLADEVRSPDLFADGSITSNKLQPGLIREEYLASGSVSGIALQPGAVGKEHLQASVVESAHLAAGSVDSDHLAERIVGPQ
ncbi:hypothetical protein BZG17_26370, partial [Escherichia coli]|nr:hypothetical protein [Escherichia coli]